MYEINIKQGYDSVAFKTENYADVDILVSTVLGLSDGNTTISITNTQETKDMEEDDEE